MNPTIVSWIIAGTQVILLGAQSFFCYQAIENWKQSRKRLSEASEVMGAVKNLHNVVQKFGQLVDFPSGQQHDKVN